MWGISEQIIESGDIITFYKGYCDIICTNNIRTYEQKRFFKDP